MDLERLIKSFKVEDVEGFLCLAHEAQRQNRLEVLDQFYEVFLEAQEDGGGNLLPLLPFFFQKIEEGSRRDKRGLSSLMRYAQSFPDLEIQKACLRTLGKISLWFEQEGRTIQGPLGFLYNLEMTKAPVFMSKPVRVELCWSKEVLFIWLLPLLEAFMSHFLERTPDCPDLKKAFFCISSGDFSKAVHHSEKALDFLRKRRKSLTKFKLRGSSHPKLGDKGPAYIETSILIARCYMTLLKTGPQRVLNSVRTCKTRLLFSNEGFVYPYSDIQDGQRLLAYLLRIPEAWTP